MQGSNLFPLVSSLLDPSVKGVIPLALELHENVAVGAMVAGVKTVDVVSAFGKGKGEVLGIIPLKTREAANVGLVYAVAAHSSDAGKLTITQNSTSNSSTTNVTNSFLIIGRIFPVAES